MFMNDENKQHGQAIKIARDSARAWSSAIIALAELSNFSNFSYNKIFGKTIMFALQMWTTHRQPLQWSAYSCRKRRSLQDDK